MGEEEARERAGLQPDFRGEYCQYPPPPLGAKAHGGLRGIVHGPRKSSPAAWVDVKPDVKARVPVAIKTRPGIGGRGTEPGVRGLLGDLNLEGLDDAPMDDLGGVRDENLAAQMKILAQN
jgi:hypothetical protein